MSADQFTLSQQSALTAIHNAAKDAGAIFKTAVRHRHNAVAMGPKLYSYILQAEAALLKVQEEAEITQLAQQVARKPREP